MNFVAGVIGGGSFGTAIANLLIENQPTALFIRRPEVLKVARATGICAGQVLNPSIILTDDPNELCQATALFPVVPSQNMAEVLQRFAPFLTPDHMLVHGVKGLDAQYSGPGVRTMSELIHALTGSTKIGCLAGPNLAREIAEGKPAATVVASQNPDVLEYIPGLLRTSRFQVLIAEDLRGIELAGVLKNIMAIAAGALHGFELGENAKALLINRAMVEMIHIGRHLGGSLASFLGAAGLGDLMATCSSVNSRNFTVGMWLSQGKSLQEIELLMEETAEGVETTRVVYKILEAQGLKAPITKMVYKVLYDGFPAREAIDVLMKVPVREDIDFI
jgi:glycerol-3-phosphate dehydrogenase (NAD(P)+)